MTKVAEQFIDQDLLNSIVRKTESGIDSSIGELTDVNLDGIQDQNVLIWQSSSQSFIAGASSGGGTSSTILPSIASLRNSTVSGLIEVSSYYGDGRGGGGIFQPDLTDSSSPDNGGSIIVRSDGVRMKRVNLNLREIDVLEWGVSDSLEDNTSRYNAIINNCPDGSVIRWTKGVQPFKGHFNSIGKAFKLIGNNAQLQNVINNQSIISMVGSAALHTTASGGAIYGANGINLNSTAGLSPEDIFYIQDRSTSGDGTYPNIELLKIYSVTPSGVDVRDMFRSNQGVGIINIYKLQPIMNPKIIGFEVLPTNTHNTNVISIWYADQPEISECTTIQTAGRAIDFRYCYGLRAFNNKCLGAISFGSGEGYGIAISFCRNFSIHNTYGRSLRHCVDCEASYCGEIRNTTHEGNQNPSSNSSLTVVTPIHNSYGGNILIDGAYGYGVFGPAVQISGQGVSNPISAIIRDMTIKNVNFRSTEVITGTVIGVYMQTSYANLTIENVQVEVPPGTQTLNSASSCCVRIGGQCHGFSLIQGLKSTRLMCGIFASVDGTIPSGMPSVGLLSIKDVFVGACNSVVWCRGVKHLETYTLTSNSVNSSVRNITTPHNGITTTTNVTGGSSAVIT